MPNHFLCQTPLGNIIIYRIGRFENPGWKNSNKWNDMDKWNENGMDGKPRAFRFAPNDPNDDGCGTSRNSPRLHSYSPPQSTLNGHSFRIPAGKKTMTIRAQI